MRGRVSLLYFTIINGWLPKRFQRKSGLRGTGKWTVPTWSHERKRIHSEKIKLVWAQRKANL